MEMKIEHVAIWVNDLEGMKEFTSCTWKVNLMKNIIIKSMNLNHILLYLAVGRVWR